jgi:hypothetical protein
VVRKSRRVNLDGVLKMLNHIIQKVSAVSGVLFCIGFISASSGGETFDHAKNYVVKTNSHHPPQEIYDYMTPTIAAGRVMVFSLKPNVELSAIPPELRSMIETIDLERQLPKRTDPSLFKSNKRADPDIQSLTDTMTVENFTRTIEYVVGFGTRTTTESIEGMMELFREMGYDPQHDYNIEVWKEGSEEPEKLVIIEGHMDTVGNTVGADDNASGATGVIEIARVFKDISTRYSILFLITEDEERGLLGAEYMVEKLRDQGRISDIQFVINMDMISYNENGRVDIETEPEFENEARWMGEQIQLYTDLEPNLVLNAWGSDHVPFINAGVPTVLTIEHWDTHTPCWHRSCDTLDTVNHEYATKILKANIAALAIKAEAQFATEANP